MLRMRRDSGARLRRLTVACACEKVSSTGRAPIRSHGEAFSVKFYKDCERTLMLRNQRDRTRRVPQANDINAYRIGPQSDHEETFAALSAAPFDAVFTPGSGLWSAQFVGRSLAHAGNRIARSLDHSITRSPR